MRWIRVVGDEAVDLVGAAQDQRDPARAAQAMIRITEAEKPPRHLVRGAFGVDAVANRLRAALAEIDAFMQWWADDCEYYEFPSRLLARGAAEIRERHVTRFREPNLFGELVHRATFGNLVVDQERVTRTFAEGPGEIDVLAIYEIVDGKIAKAWFKMGAPRLHGTAG